MGTENQILKLEYFNIAGRAEKVRLALVLAGIPFEDIRIKSPDWPTRKATAKYGQLPIMTLPSGEEVYQSDAMLRYAGSLGDESLYPKDNHERLKVEEALGLIGDLSRAWSPSLYVGMKPTTLGYDANMPADEKDQLMKSMREKFLKEELPNYMGYFTDLIEKSNNKYLCGDDLTIADLSALHSVLYFKRGVADYVPKESLDPYPVVTAWIDRVMAYPKIAEYYENKK
uniref:Glutathione transferase n=1 Tax=Eucampia antarctica TaxID=49252 RepID=A0A7S2WA57_9STRA|mmetsp:Transcript_24350/g.23399  ORF Transcript_24350/g.23399 Transcript_24350/m.23399 type:complete len:228 (+) Transcript_24350:78-761(+)